MLWQVKKELEKVQLSSSEGDKGDKGGLSMNHYDLPAIRNVFHLAHYLTKPTKVAQFCSTMVYTEI